MTNEYRETFCEGYSEMKEKVEYVKEKYTNRYKDNEYVLKIIKEIFWDILIE